MAKDHAPLSKEIGKLLDKADDRHLLAVMDMIERLQTRQEFERHLDPIRPKLALLRPPRPATVTRILVTPFENALVADGQWQSGCGSIERSKLKRLIQGMLNGLHPDEIAEIDGRMRPIRMNQTKEVGYAGKEIWPKAANALEDCDGEGDVSLDEQRKTAARFLDVADLMFPLSEVLPAFPMGELSDYHISSIKRVLAHCERRSPEAFAAGVQWLVTRSFKPMTILKLLLRGEIGQETIGNDNLAHRLARQILIKQRIVLINQRLEGRAISEITAEVEASAGSFLSVAERAREFDLTNRDIEQVNEVLRSLLMKLLSLFVSDKYFRALETLDDPELPDEQVEAIEAEARSVQRLLSLAEACGIGQQAKEIVEVAAENAAAELRGRYGAKANPMTVVDQIRTFEFVFGGEQARKLWQEFATRRQNGFEPAKRESGPTPAQAMRSALKLG